jgi:O-antigen/teichoic acid export membrane protein
MLAILLPVLIPLVFGQEYSGAVLPAQFLCAAFFLNVVRQALISTLRGLGSTWPAVWSEVASVVIFAGVLGLTYDALSPAGIAIGLTLGHLAALTVLAGYIYKRYQFSLEDWNGFTAANINAFVHACRAALARR